MSVGNIDHMSSDDHESHVIYMHADCDLLDQDAARSTQIQSVAVYVGDFCRSVLGHASCLCAAAPADKQRC